jgi:sorbitol/mannitol transport system substrate-binding protein
MSDGNSKPKPYTGVQYAAIPEFQGVATAVGQQFSAALAGQNSAGQALESAQQLTERVMKRAGYIK